ncbi:MAG: heavy metal translocating P-type ATPase [Geminicoccaceae bacterium]
MTAPVRTPLAISIPVEGMTCASCVSHVEEAIEAVPGVASVSVNLATERAEVSFRDRSDLGAVRKAVEAAGYSVGTETAEFDIDGMHCASCVNAVETALRGVPGVAGASVNLATNRATVTRLAGAAPDQRLVAAIAAEGYTAERHADASPEGVPDRRAAALADLWRRTVLAAALAAPVVVLAMGPHLIPAMHHWLAAMLGANGGAYLQLVLAAAVLLGPGLQFFILGIRSLTRLKPDMNALVAIGTGAAFLYSAVATVAPGVLPAGAAGVYFEASALIVTLILLGRYLEARARGQASEAIGRLLRLAPKTARVERVGSVEEIPIERLVVGDVVQVQPGERIAVDGVVIEGSSHVDESILTGEPMPVAKQAGSSVIGGSLNQAGAFSFRATKVGADTFLAGIVRLVEGAQAAKLPIQALVDRVTGWFVPAVIGLAALTFVLWLAFGPEPTLGPAIVAAVAVLIIACPCAMGLATPMSILVGTGRAAELGVLFRRGDALQSLSSVEIVALDKTGTLTVGRPALTDIVTADGFAEPDVLALAAAAESRSEHPLAKAIVDAAKDRGVAIAPAEDVRVEPGLGVRALVAGRTVVIGNRRMMERLGLDPSHLANEAARLADQGKTSFFVAVDGRVAAVLAVSDPIKPNAQEAVGWLKALGLRVAMITGDNERTARAIALKAGIEEVVANVDPAGKLAAIRNLKADGAAVAFVGDGINDAPALAEADVGVAMGTGTDVAIEAAEVVLVSGNLDGVANAVAISRATLRNIRQNLFWAFAYNATLIPIAAGVLYPLAEVQLTPVLAAAAMALSSVFVVANALRLRSFGGPPRRARRRFVGRRFPTSATAR